MATKHTATDYKVTIEQLCTSALNERLLILVGITPDQAQKHQRALGRICMLPSVKRYLCNFCGYQWTDDPINLTRFLYILRCYCQCRSKLVRISMPRHAMLLKRQCLENLFSHYPTAQAIEDCMKNHRRRLPDDIRQLVSEQ